VPVTTIFDDGVFGDSDQFDIVNRYSVTIEESKTIFDSAVFGDTDQFDTTTGGIISVDDILARTLASTRSLSESESITDSISRLQNIFRTITAITVTVGVGLVTTLQTLGRTIVESQQIFDNAVFGDTDQFDTTPGGGIFVTDTVATLNPSISRYIFDIGYKFDSVIFGDSDQFDLAQGTYEITDSVTRQMSTFRTLVESISITDSVSRLLKACRSITESTIAMSDAV